MSENKTVTVNGRPVSQEELEEMKKEVAQQRGVELQEIAPGTYKKTIKG